MRLQMQIVQALGFGVMENHQFYKRVDEMTETSVGPPPWLINNKKGRTSKMGGSDRGSCLGHWQFVTSQVCVGETAGARH